jgi:hypothetical protein
VRVCAHAHKCGNSRLPQSDRGPLRCCCCCCCWNAAEFLCLLLLRSITPRLRPSLLGAVDGGGLRRENTVTVISVRSVGNTPAAAPRAGAGGRRRRHGERSGRSHRPHAPHPNPSPTLPPRARVALRPPAAQSTTQSAAHAPSSRRQPDSACLFLFASCLPSAQPPRCETTAKRERRHRINRPI